MMDRQILLSVLGAMPTEKLLEALSVTGLVPKDGGADVIGALNVNDGGNNHIQSWNDRTVKYSGGADRPDIADKKWAEGSGEMNAQMPREGQMDDGVDPTNVFLQTGGGA